MTTTLELSVPLSDNKPRAQTLEQLGKSALGKSRNFPWSKEKPEIVCALFRGHEPVLPQEAYGAVTRPAPSYASRTWNLNFCGGRQKICYIEDRTSILEHKRYQQLQWKVVWQVEENRSLKSNGSNFNSSFTRESLSWVNSSLSLSLSFLYSATNNVSGSITVRTGMWRYERS